MTRQAPYLQRRGDVFFLRVAVPADLQSIVGGREITRTLRTTDKRVAVPLALEMAASVKRLFMDLRIGRGDVSDSKLMEVVRDAKRKIEIAKIEERHEDDLIAQRRQHLRELEVAGLRAKAEVLDQLMAAGVSLGASRSAEPTPAPAPLFSAVIDHFLKTYNGEKKAAMLMKHKAVLPVMLEIIGDKPVSELKQADLMHFFDVLLKLPPRWKDAVRKRGCTLLELADMSHTVTIGPKTFEDTYKASVRVFLTRAKALWLDQGFPVTLTTNGVEYVGDREPGENKQRAFLPEELKRLFEGASMRSFAEDPAQAHRYWLPHIGLFTGARVNEVCQLNPQLDIIEIDGVRCFNMTEETEGDERIRKRVKNATSKRYVPIHPTLIKLGFMDYVASVQARGAKLLFPDWPPEKGKASAKGEKWFRALIAHLDLRDETPGARLVGFHAFRSTLLNFAMNQHIDDAEAITGHADEDGSVVVRGCPRAGAGRTLPSPDR